MSRTGKVIVMSIGGMLAVCICLGLVGLLALQGTGSLLGRMIDTNPAAVAGARDAIANYTVPAGFDDGAAVTIAGFSMITHSGDDGRSHIYLIQEPSWLDLDQAELERQASQASGAEAWSEIREVDRQQCQIRGQDTTLVVSEGVSHDNGRYRSASTLFEGKGGTVLLNISAPAESWDEEMVQDFIESVQ